MIYAIYAIIAIVFFLVMLNNLSRGAWKRRIDAFLSLLILCLFVASFFVAGWKAGLVAIGVAFLSALITRPLAARTASKISALVAGESGGHFPGLPPKLLEQIEHERGRQVDLFLQHGTIRYSDAEEALLEYCIADSDIEKVMVEYDISKDDLHKLYKELVAVGCGQWRCGHFVAASALAYSETLRYIMHGKEKKWRFEETAYKVLMYFERGTSLSD